MHALTLPFDMKKLNRELFVFVSAIIAFLFLVVALGFSGSLGGDRSPRHAASVASPFIYSFNASGILNEAGSMDQSSSPYWWLNSGGQLIMDGGFGKTMQGTASLLNPWRILYALSNPIDTDNGTHPQNLFRLISRSTWGNVSAQVTFRITKLNLSDSPNRNASNGVLLMGRYRNSDDTYYAGLRDDGQAVIKKKIGGTYYTLGSVQIFGTAGKYNRDTFPTLLPSNTWMALKVNIQDAWAGSVLIRLYLDRENDGSFVSILSARDTGTDGAPLRGSGYLGLRTDFKDVEFDSFRAEKL